MREKRERREEGGRERGSLPSRFPRAQNPLSRPLQTPATQATLGEKEKKLASEANREVIWGGKGG